MFQTNQLVIVGGLTAVGKTTLLNTMQQDKIPVLFSQISMSNPDLCFYAEAQNLSKVRQPFVDQLILHYDFIHQKILKGDHSQLSDLIDRSNNVCALTLCIPSTMLVERISSRLEQIKKTLPVDVKRIKLLEKKKKAYGNRDKLLNAYEKWFEFIEACEVPRHMIINSADDYLLTWAPDLNEARKILATTLAGQSQTREQWRSPLLTTRERKL